MVRQAHHERLNKKSSIYKRLQYILLPGNGLAPVAAVLQANGWADVLLLMQIAALLAPVLLAGLLLLCFIQPQLNKLDYRL